MISLSKKEILESLMRVSMTIEHIVTNPDRKIISFLVEDYLEMDENQYYYDYKIFLQMIGLRLLSYTEDSFLDIVDNSKIDLSDIKNKIFINKKDSNKFSNKQIIKYIRNAVSHSDYDKELFKISPNGRFVEVDLKNTKPIPFHIKIEYEDLLKIVNITLKASKGVYCTLVDSESNKIRRIYYKKSQNGLSNRLTLPNDLMFGSDDYMSIIIKYFKENNVSYEIKEYQLMSQQIALIKNFKEIYSEVIRDFPEFYNELYIAFLERVIPLPQEKLYNFFNSIELFIQLYRNPDYTYNQFSKEIINGYLKAFSNNSKSDEELSELAKFYYTFQMENDQNMEHYFRTLMALSIIKDVSLTEFITYFFSCICPKENIEMNGETFDKENIRDALIHGRWFNDINHNIICCDSKNGKNNDYNFYWSKTLPLKETVKYCINYNNQIDHHYKR